MTRSRYLNRWVNIHTVCHMMVNSRGVTSTELSKSCDLSRQSILKILKDAETQGYVSHKKIPYRQHFKTVWFLNDYWIANQHIHMNLVNNYNKLKQMELGL